jgi:hypothetical protein
MYFGIKLQIDLKTEQFLDYFQGNRTEPSFFKPEKAAFRRQNGLLSSLP